MNELELNKKLAEWRWVNAQVYIPRAGGEIRVRIDGQTTQYDLFTQSLDACFKWLVPKLQDKGYMVTLISFEHRGYRVEIEDVVHSEEVGHAANDNSALALCLAIEKLIDLEANNENKPKN